VGLDTTHDCWHGAYSAFSRWREALAQAAGYELKLIKYPDGFSANEVQCVNWEAITEENLAGRWDRTPEEPLVVLFAHSDCEGAIYPAQAGPLADRLENLLPKLTEMGDGVGHIGYYEAKTRAFIDGLRAAVKSNEPVEFH
jgi:hypothetical protein